jgi:hypothetical protein
MTDDIQAAWKNIARRLQSIACGKNNGIAVLTIRIAIDEWGNPIAWSEPEMTRIEPKRAADDLMRLLTKGGQ